MNSITQEQWRPIEGYEGLYEVSNLGRVRSLGYRNERILRLGTHRDGYLLVFLFKEGKRKTFYVHRLVAQAFIPNQEGLPEINHRDEDKTNNVVFLNPDGSFKESNLEWCDRKYNVNYGTGIERMVKNMVQTKIRNGTSDPELCGISDKKEYARLYYQKNREKKLEYQRKYYQKNKERVKEYHQENRERLKEYQREYDRQRRLRKKQKNKKDNHPSEESLW